MEVINRIDVQNDPVNFVDPWGLMEIKPHPKYSPGPGPHKGKIQKRIDKADRLLRRQIGNNILKSIGLPAVVSSPQGAALAAALWVLAPKDAGDPNHGDMLNDWDQNGNGIPDLIEPLPNDC